jgi:hypothetical protein
MSTYVVISALIFAVVAIGHAIRLANVSIMGRPCSRCPDLRLGLRAISVAR